jgi:hypothetical protein
MTNVTYKYATVLVAIQNLRNEGYNVDFNLEENCLICGNNIPLMNLKLNRSIAMRAKATQAMRQRCMELPRKTV